ncbi:hypothetical protein LXM25_00410 [Dyadobacter sp. LJ53]|uniref:hypothetical protein n=1 Tax=Dyadobacter chenwenxiniae TaxID=2906456 RepID=UPI001F2E2B74|nr:hypothetical protein [Dyadobacter chenwenxiniae]MCF0048493.1 hypothetical protein [Dyadobacter chenwenxiniae]
MLKFYTKLALAAVGLLIFSCNLQDHVIPTTPIVYVAGYEYTGKNNTAKLWRNGEAADLMTNSKSIVTSSIAALGGDVHVVGWSGDSTSAGQARYWKNGVLQPFSGQYLPSVLSKVLLSGSDVYVAGSGGDAGGHYAMYWKNGVPEKLNNALGGWARDMAIVDGDVYVTGNASGGIGELAVAKYWKNGASVELTSGPEQHFPNGIAVSGGDVHVVGTMGGKYRTIAKYWKNGVENILSPSSYHSNANDIAVLGNDVYIVGNVGDSLSHYSAKIWKNGVAASLPGGVEATGITIVGNDVYVSGAGLNGFTSVAKYWKNGVPVALSNGETNSTATAIFVTAP